MSAGLNVAVIGGGWAGCTVAVELLRKGHRVTLFESSRTLGGRARCVNIHGKTLDNGQHILLGAYTETLRLMRIVNLNPDEVLLRLPLQMRYPSATAGMDFIAPRLPAPLHLFVALLRAKGLDRADKMALARFSTTARWMAWRLNTDCSVAELMERFDQTERLISLLWRPLCIAALNTPPERASAQIFLNVLRDSLGSHSRASNMLIPRVHLSALFPAQAAFFIERHGGTIQYGMSIKKVLRDNNGRWKVDVSPAPPLPSNISGFDHVVIATHPAQAKALLHDLIDTNSLASFVHEPITTCYLQYTSDCRLSQPFFALRDNSLTEEWGQFVFDRGQLDQNHAGLLAVVISASSEAIEFNHENLAASIAKQLASTFCQPALSHPQWTKIISEKQATFSCIPAIVRPDVVTEIPGLLIAGDYTASDYPATLEAAVRSGIRAAKSICEGICS